jgi:hypothetical protein
MPYYPLSVNMQLDNFVQLHHARSVEEAQALYAEDETLLQVAGVSRPIRNMVDVKKIVEELTMFLVVSNTKDAYAA